MCLCSAHNHHYYIQSTYYALNALNWLKNRYLILIVSILADINIGYQYRPRPTVLKKLLFFKLDQVILLLS